MGTALVTGASTGLGRAYAVELARRGVLAKETHGVTVRLSPPLVNFCDELDVLVATFGEVLRPRRSRR